MRPSLAQRHDPSRTGTIVRMYGSEINRRARSFQRAVSGAISKRDALGMERRRLITQTIPLPPARSFALDKRQFDRWLDNIMTTYVLEETSASAPDWIQKYVRAAYAKGMTKALRSAAQSNRELVNLQATSMLTLPQHQQRLTQLYARNYVEVKAYMQTLVTLFQRVIADQTMRRNETLSELVLRLATETLNIREIAQALAQILGLKLWEGQRIARTEIIRAHAEAQLNTFEQFQIEEIELFAEWLTAGDGRVCPECAAKEGKKFTIEQARGMIPLHPNCLIAETLVASSSRITNATQRWYEGPVVIIQTDAGNQLTCTPNHPILGNHGWIAANLVQVGSDVIGLRFVDGSMSSMPNDERMPAPIEEIAHAFLQSVKVATVKVPVAAEDFHGDGEGSKVCIIGSDRDLSVKGDTLCPKHRIEFAFQFGYVGRASLLAQRAALQLLHSPLRPADRSMSSLNLLAAFAVRHLLPFNQLCFAGAPQLDVGSHETDLNGPATTTISPRQRINANTGFVTSNKFLDVDFLTDIAAQHNASSTERSRYRSNADAELAAQLLRGQSGPIKRDKVIDVQTRFFAGHVFNLETELGSYIANGIVTHNCRCDWIPWQEGNG